MKASAIILAAGAGTRMKSSHPKVVHKLLGKPLIRWAIDAARSAGASSIITVVGHEREQVEPLVADTTIVVQPGRRGTADAVSVCRDACRDIHGSLLVLSGDCPLVTPDTIRHLAEVRDKRNAAVAVLTMQPADPFGYGRIVRDDQGDVERIVEQKDCTPEEAALTECNSGLYCFDSDALFDALNKVSDGNAQGEYYLTDVLEISRQAGRTVVAVPAAHSDECLGINTRSQLAQATQIMRQRINESHMDAGVTMLDPSMVWIGPDVTIDPDVELLPMTFLNGHTHIGSGTVVGPNSRLTDTVVGTCCTIDETVALDTRIDNDCTCGPRAYLRPGTHLCDGAKAGTHVEIKKSTIGPGSKVPHLSYIGDTTMGGGVNVGAGSITCNYDGTRKWPTHIGDNAFIGSDTMMVAPVSIGEHALVGAGSVITKEVPADALALGRARQVVKPLWNKSKDKA